MALGEFFLQLFNQRDDRIFCVVHGEQDFVIGIVLAAEAGVVFVGAEIDAADWFEQTDRRSEVSKFSFALAQEKAKRGDGRCYVVREGSRCDKQQNVAGFAAQMDEWMKNLVFPSARRSFGPCTEEAPAFLVNSVAYPRERVSAFDVSRDRRVHAIQFCRRKSP